MRRAALDEARAASAMNTIGVYASSFVPELREAEGYATNEVILGHRADLDPLGCRAVVESWLDAGATIVGGCCGIMPEHIELLDRPRP